MCPQLSESKIRILKDHELIKHLRFPLETGRLLGREISSWCEFHKTHGHDTEDCYSLTGQLISLAHRGLMNKYIKDDQPKTELAKSCSSPKPSRGPHEIPILGDFNTIAGGFAGGRSTRSARKRYARSVMMTTTSGPLLPIPDMMFTKKYLEDVVPHEDDPVVLSVILMGRNVHRVLIDQGSSTDVMFWEAFVGL